jgi:hypothetical protein
VQRRPFPFLNTNLKLSIILKNMMVEQNGERLVTGDMRRRQIKLVDGRYLSFYTFDKKDEPVGANVRSAEGLKNKPETNAHVEPAAAEEQRV